jgi:hypothetical protein
MVLSHGALAASNQSTAFGPLIKTFAFVRGMRGKPSPEKFAKLLTVN